MVLQIFGHIHNKAPSEKSRREHSRYCDWRLGIKLILKSTSMNQQFECSLIENMQGSQIEALSRCVLWIVGNTFFIPRLEERARAIACHIQENYTDSLQWIYCSSCARRSSKSRTLRRLACLYFDISEACVVASWCWFSSTMSSYSLSKRVNSWLARNTGGIDMGLSSIQNGNLMGWMANIVVERNHLSFRCFVGEWKELIILLENLFLCDESNLLFIFLLFFLISKTVGRNLFHYTTDAKSRPEIMNRVFHPIGHISSQNPHTYWNLSNSWLNCST